MNHPKPKSLLCSARGLVNWVSLLLVVLLVGGGYLAWTWAPVYITHFQAKQIVRDYMNQAVKEPNDEMLKERMVENLRRLARKDGVDRFGRPAHVAVVNLRSQDVTWERDLRSTPRVLHVAFDYEHEVTYPFLERKASKVMSIDLTNELTVPDWGITR